MSRILAFALISSLFGSPALAVDRSQMPAGEEPPGYEPPAFETRSLSDGLELVFVHNDRVPMVTAELVMPGGSLTDPEGKEGLARLTAALLVEGTTNRDSLTLSDELQVLASSLWGSAYNDASHIQFECLSENLEPTLDLFVDVLMNPTFPTEQFERVRDQLKASVRRSYDSPSSVARRAFTRIAWQRQLTGRIQATEASLDKILREDVVEHHKTWYRPARSTLVVIGSTDLETLVAALEERLGAWGGAAPEIRLPDPPEPHPGNTIFVVDKPGTTQSSFVVGNLAFGWENPDEMSAFSLANRAFGGLFMSRLNLKLREEKAYTYGARSSLSAYRVGGHWSMSSQVRADVTAPALRDALDLLDGITGDTPITDDELEVMRRNTLESLPMRYETIDGLTGGVSGLVRVGRSHEWLLNSAERVKAVTLEQAQAAFDRWVRPEAMVAVVVGDASKIAASLSGLDRGQLVPIDEEGNVLPGEVAAPADEAAEAEGSDDKKRKKKKKKRAKKKKKSN
jgi:zinc protease